MWKQFLTRISRLALTGALATLANAPMDAASNDGQPRTTDYPASTMDIFPTVADVLQLPQSALLEPVDGVSLLPLFEKELARRAEPIPFRFRGRGALIGNDLKLVSTSIEDGRYELYDLKEDPRESRDIAESQPEAFERMRSRFLAWNESVEASERGEDYPEGKILEDEPEPRTWMSDKRYTPYLDEWEKRPEYARRIARARQEAD